MRTIIFGPWVGEFSYEVQWWIPEIRQISSESNCKTIVVGYPGREALYRDFIDEYISMPPEILKHCTNPNCWAQRDNVTKALYLPRQVIEFYNNVCSRYENVTKHLPHAELIDRRFNENPYGLYKNINHYNEAAQPIIDLLLSNFKFDNTVCIVPKLRKRDEVNIDHETWPVNIWESIVNTLTNKNLNVISFLFKVNGTNPGTYDLSHLSSKYNDCFKQIDLNCDYSLDIQIGLLKNTFCSIYGSTGAAILPIICNTKMITYQVKESGWRLNFEWQQRLTNNHKYISIKDKYPIDKFKDISITEINNDINEYIEKLKISL